ncbi:MAG: oxidoreductase of aldo/keto reductase family, subgroup 1 [Pseudolabrys sp.]|jgi:diketogulonate reductase-like aldo/keto reductase|nr:oxidoreductase of aldo/keto reductase family, subgroup 1 [Pseudolabrys sp.]
MTDMPVVESGGAKIPIVGLGTWTLGGRDCVRLVEAALDAGYRHIDTAQMYGNEAEVGEAVRRSGRRDAVFVTTKVAPGNLSARDFERSAKDSLSQMRLPFVDLLLIHWPNSSIPLAETIGALNKMRREGLTKHIGVSNFTVALLEEAIRLSDAPIVCNQFECHPFLDQDKLIAACRKHKVAVVAYSPVARGRAEGSHVLERIGKAHGKSAAQVSLRWLVQQGIVVIPRTSKVERLKENIDLFDFELSAADMKAIGTLSHAGGRIVNFAGYAPQWD